MGKPLDAILRFDLVGSRDDDGTTNSETINVTGNSESIDVSGSEQGVMVQFDYDNGVTTNVEFIVEGSIDNVTFAPIEGADQVVTDSNGVVIYDFIDLNSNFIRAAWTVNSGSVDIYVQASAKRRH